jgi:hypothetical protein
MNGTETQGPLSFHWAGRETASWWLAGFTLVSLLLHSAAFFIFHGEPPPVVRSPRTAPSVRLLTAFDNRGRPLPENAALLQWIATQDPALVASTPGVEPKGLLPIGYKPSYQTVRTQPLGVPPEPATISFPPPADPVALIQSAMPRPESSRVAPVPQPTRITVGGPLARRVPGGLSLAPAAKVSKPVEPTTVVAGVSSAGEVRFTFPQQSCGDARLDGAATEFLRGLRFAPATETIEWGMITFVWGDDAFGHGQPPPR